MAADNKQVHQLYLQMSENIGSALHNPCLSVNKQKPKHENVIKPTCSLVGNFLNITGSIDKSTHNNIVGKLLLGHMEERFQAIWVFETQSRWKEIQEILEIHMEKHHVLSYVQYIWNVYFYSIHETLILL